MKIGQEMVEGFAWGQAAKLASDPFKNIDAAIEASNSEALDALKKEIGALLEAEGKGIALFKSVDSIFDQYAAFEELREYMIDLCVVKLLQELEEGEEDEEQDALDSPEWEKIEAAAEDRGTELLNALIYIKDCRLNETEPGMEDFLYNFLLAGEDDFQEEMAIYEPFVRQIDLVDAPLKQLIEAGNDQRDYDLADLFTPMLLFFRDPIAKQGKITLNILEFSAEPALHCALHNLLIGFNSAEI